MLYILQLKIMQYAEKIKVLLNPLTNHSVHGKIIKSHDIMRYIWRGIEAVITRRS